MSRKLKTSEIVSKYHTKYFITVYYGTVLFILRQIKLILYSEAKTDDFFNYNFSVVKEEGEEEQTRKRRKDSNVRG